MKLHNVFIRLVFSISAAIGIGVVSLDATAQEAPDAMVKRISVEVIDTIKTDKGFQSGSINRIQELVESRILPYVDFKRTTALAAGHYWKEATPEQQRQLTNEFRSLLIHTYSGALAQVKDQKLEFKPLRADPADTEVEVQAQVTQARAEPIQLGYRLVKGTDGWKIYDINFLGAWLTQSYRSSFAAEVDRGGIDGLIRVLADKNRKLADSSLQAPSKRG